MIAMQKLNQVIFYTGLAGMLVLLALLLAHGISWNRAILLLPVSIGLAIAGVSLMLLQNASGIAKYAGTACAAAGPLILIVGALQWIEMENTWNIGASLSMAALTTGIFIHSTFAGAFLKWAGYLTAALLLTVAAGIALKIGYPFFYLFAGIALAIFSVLALIASVTRPE